MPPTLLHVFATFAVGGPQVRFAAIANHFGPRWRHLIVAMDGNVAARERLDPGLDVGFPEIVIRKGDTLGNVRRFRAALRGLRPDALLTNNWGSIEWVMANRLAALTGGGIRQVHIEDGFGPEERSRQLPRRAITRRVVLHRRLVVLPSRSLWDIATGVWRLDPRFLHYVPNGIDLSRFSQNPEADVPWPRDLPVIGTVSALRPEKNIARLIRAFGLLGDVPARLVIVGDGPERAALEAAAAATTGGATGALSRIAFAGHSPNPASLLGGFDIFALSSDTEQMPLSVLEAMAAGLPVAATDVGDLRSMLAPENEPFLASLDDAVLAETLRALLAVPAHWPAIGTANRARAEAEFDQATMFEAWNALFKG